MKNDTFATPEILDVTEVEKVKLHEEAETRRHLIAEREETKRAKTVKWTDGRFLFGLVLVCVAVSLSTMGGWMFYMDHKYPTVEKGPPCSESIQLVRPNEIPRTCPPGAVMETKVGNQYGDVEMHCVCKK